MNAAAVFVDQLESMIGRVESIIPIDGQGGTAVVSAFQTRKGRFAVKCATDTRYREWLRVEGTVLQSMNGRRNVQVPLYVGMMETADATYLVMAHEPGRTLTNALRHASRSESLHLAEQFGAYLYSLHTTPVPLRTPQWIDRQLKVAEREIGLGRTEGTKDLLDRLVQEKPVAVQETLIHGDCTTDNVMTDGVKMTRWIDVAAMTVGDPRYDVALAIRRFRDDAGMMDAFYRGYKGQRLSDQEFVWFDEGLYEFF